MPTASHLPLAERCRPRSLKDIVGQPEAVRKLRAFGESWQQGTHPPRIRAALLEGVPGTGKTSAALALAHDLGWGVVEMNASDARNRTAIEQVAGRAAITNTFTSDGRFLSSRKGERNLIILDEADCLSGRSAREGSEEPSRTPPTFREFLETRYRRIEALNEAWHLGQEGNPDPFPSFHALPTGSPGRAAWARLPQAQADLRDWRGASNPPDLSDRGGLLAVAKLIRETLQPVILTVNNSRPLTKGSAVFRTGVTRVRFYPLREESVRGALHRISMAENLGFSDEVIDLVVAHVKGDLRAGVNDLEALSGLPPGVDPATVLGYRDLESNLYEATHRWLTAGRLLRNTDVMEGVDASPEDMLPWIEENVPRYAPGPEELSRAMERLARAQFYLGKASRLRVWTLWSYASEIMTGGGSLALFPEGPASVGRQENRVEFPRFLAGMGSSRGQRAVQHSLLTKLARRTHLSQRRTPDLILPLVKPLFQRSPAAREMEALLRFQSTLARELDLSAEEIAFLLDQEPDHPSVTRILKEAQHVSEPLTPPPPSPETPAAPARGQRKLF